MNKKKGGLSQTAIQALQIATEVVFALCLLVAVGVRANLISLYYLLVFCYGVVQSFESKVVASVTMAVSLLACIAHGVFIYMFQKQPETAKKWTSGSVTALFGFEKQENAVDYLATIGVDALVFCVTAFHVFYVLRRIQAQKLKAFDVFEFGEHMMRNDGDATPAAHFRRQKLLKWFEVLCGFLLFLTAMSLPAFATGVYYVLLLLRLINWTFFTKKVTVAQLIYCDTNSTSKAIFLGPIVAKVLLALSVLIINVWYVDLRLLACLTLATCELTMYCHSAGTCSKLMKSESTRSPWISPSTRASWTSARRTSSGPTTSSPGASSCFSSAAPSCTTSTQQQQMTTTCSISISGRYRLPVRQSSCLAQTLTGPRRSCSL